MKGLELKNIVLESGYTQVIFAQKIGISVKTLQNWINRPELSDKASFIVTKAIKNNVIQIDTKSFLNSGDSSTNKVNESLEDYVPLKEVEKLRVENENLKSEVKKLKEKNDKITKELFNCKDELISVLRNAKK